MARLNEALPGSWSRNNPVDVLGDAGPDRYDVAVRACLEDPGIDAVLVVLTPQAQTAAQPDWLTVTRRAVCRLSPQRRMTTPTRAGAARLAAPAAARRRATSAPSANRIWRRYSAFARPIVRARSRLASVPPSQNPTVKTPTMATRTSGVKFSISALPCIAG